MTADSKIDNGDPALMGIEDQMNESGGQWQPCTGCYDTEDGHPTQKYDYSPALQTPIGCGCSECGGLGAVWWYMSDQDVDDWEKICDGADSEADLLHVLKQAVSTIQDYLAYKHDGDPWEEDARVMGEMDINAFGSDGRLDAALAVIAKAEGRT